MPRGWAARKNERVLCFTDACVCMYVYVCVVVVVKGEGGMSAHGSSSGVCVCACVCVCVLGWGVGGGGDGTGLASSPSPRARVALVMPAPATSIVSWWNPFGRVRTDRLMPRPSRTHRSISSKWCSVRFRWFLTRARRGAGVWRSGRNHAKHPHSLFCSILLRGH